MSKIDEQLAALEDVAGVIDPRDDRALSNFVAMCMGSTDVMYRTIALAVYEQQAREWIEKWCFRHHDDFRTEWHCLGSRKYSVAIFRAGTGVRKQFLGHSYAHALAAAIKRLTELDKEMDDGCQ